MELSKHERLLLAKKQKGSRTDRKLKKYSEQFNEIFTFYLQVYRKGIITFCGSNVEVLFDLNSSDSKYAFREYDNGRYKELDVIKSRHNNILKAVLIGKKGWGLWVKLWSEGIAECDFTKEEILLEFEKNNITLPEPMNLEFDNLINNLKQKKYENKIL